MLRAIGRILADGLRRWIPDPFVFAIGLTILVGLLAVVVTPASGLETLQAWYRGFFGLLEFGMQVVLILTTGFAIALSPAVARFVDWVAVRVNTPTKVYFVVVALGGVFSLVSWGWLVLAAVLARELAQRVKGLDYGYLVACCYFSMTPWVGGLSSSIPLLLNTPGNFLIETGILESTVPIGNTLGSFLNLAWIAAFYAIFPLMMVLLAPHTKDSGGIDTLVVHDAINEQKSVAEEAAATMDDVPTPSDRLNHSTLLAAVISGAGLIYIAWHFVTRGFDLNLNIMVFIFVTIGLAAHRTPIRYVIAMKRACSNVSGIIFQYPFYAGIMGMMQYTGLGEIVATWMAAGASVLTLPLIAQATGAVINFAIPSAGGEWAVLGPTFIEAARTLAVDMDPTQFNEFVARVALAIAYGESSTNALQPFFLLIVLPIMGAGVKIQARDVMGYLVLPFLALYLLTAVMVTFAPL